MPAFVSHPRPVLIGLLLVVMTGTVFHAVPTAGFVRWDDGMHVYANPYLHPVSSANLARFWKTPYQNLYIPLSYSLYALLAATAHLPRPVPTPDGLWISTGSAHLSRRKPPAALSQCPARLRSAAPSAALSPNGRQRLGSRRGGAAVRDPSRSGRIGSLDR